MYKVTSVMGDSIGEAESQECGSTQSSLRVLQHDKAEYAQAYYVGSDDTTDKSEILHEFGGKRRKLDMHFLKSNEERRCNIWNQPAAIHCDANESPAVRDKPNTRGLDVTENIILARWLEKPGRAVHRFDCLHIFKQILEFVDLAHSQGVVLRNVRPSSFILSCMHRVSFVDTSIFKSGSGSSKPSMGTPSKDGSPLLKPNLHDSLASVYDKEMPASPMVQPRAKCLGSCSHEEEPFKRGLVNLQSTQHRIGGNYTGWGYNLMNAGTVCQPNIKSGVEYLKDFRGSHNVFGIASSTIPDTVRKTDRYEDESNRNYCALLMSGGINKDSDDAFSVRHTSNMEETWYVSPEELLTGSYSYAADIYSLGVLCFELFCPFHSWEEHTRRMFDLRHRILPPSLLSDCPKEAAFCLWLLHPDPNCRPKAREILQSELLTEAGEALAERQAAMDIEQKEVDTLLLHEFLMQVLERKQDLAKKLAQEVHFLSSDIDEVEKRRISLRHNGTNPLFLGESAASSELTGNQVLNDSVILSTSFLGHSTQEQSKYESVTSLKDEYINSRKLESAGDKILTKRKENACLRSSRLMSNFKQLQQVYFAMRSKMVPKVSDKAGCSPKYGGQIQQTKADGSFNCKSHALGSIWQKSLSCKADELQETDMLGCFFESLCKYARYSKFLVKATLRHGDLLNTASMVCSMSFDRDQEYFATAGVCKRIKVFECNAVMNENVDIHYPVIEMCSRSKISSVCWNSYIKSHIASSDYDGIVQLWDAATGQTLMRYREHEKRVWSVDFSQADPTKLASGSDDGFVKLWSINQESSIGTIKTKANICCVQFPPVPAHLITFGSADFKIYCYDLRNMKTPWCSLINHSKAVSYVKFLDAVTLVSASTDNTLKLWDLSKASSTDGNNNACVLTYTGHTNEKNFVGLSVMDGYIACGSETNSVFAYHKSLPMPMTSHKFGYMDPISGHEIEDDTSQFISSVCWRGKSQILIAANSMGSIKILEMV